MEKMKVLIADDNKKFLKSLKFFIENFKDTELIGQATNGTEAVEMARVLNPDIVIMDIEMPGLNGIEATKKILWKNRDIKIIAISSFTDSAYLTELLGTGFKAFISKNNLAREFNLALREVIEGKFYFPENVKISK